MKLDDDLHAFIETLGSDWTIEEASEKFLADVDRSTLAEWQDERVRAHVAQTIRSFIGGERRKAMKRAFGESVPADMSDAEAVSHFRSLWSCEGNVWKRLADMDRSDCLFVSETYEAKAIDARFKAEVHRAIAKRLTNGRTVKEVFTEEQLRRMFGEN